MSPRSRNCSVFGCLNTYRDEEDLSFFRLPQDEKRRMQWLKLIGRDDLMDKDSIHHYVCQIHFNDDAIRHNNMRKSLNKSAVPSLHLPFKDDKETQTELETFNISTQTCMGIGLYGSDADLATGSDTEDIKSEIENISETPESPSADTSRKRKLEFELWESELSECEKRLKEDPDCDDFGTGHD